MRGSLRERRAGVWELIVQLPRDATSARARQLSRTVQGTKREAQRALAAMVAEVAAGKVSSTAMTMGELMARWLDHVDEQLAATTVREYRRIVAKTLDPDLGALSLRRITTQRLDTCYAGFSRDRGLSPATVRHLQATQLLAAGVPVRTVSGRLGHADAATTLNVYAHFLEASERQAADVIAGLLSAGTAQATQPR